MNIIYTFLHIYKTISIISASFSTFVLMCKVLISKMTTEHPDVVPYLCNKFIPLLKEGVVNVVRDSVFTTSWTNNNAESLNHVLKQLIDWKPKPLPTLINLISKHIDSQFRDLERAMIGMGKFELASDYQHFRLKVNLWAGKPLAVRAKIYSKCIKFVPKNNKIVTSADNQLTFPKTSSAGKKPNQVKRKRTERAARKKQKL